jgi:hypothetical protein
MTVAETPAWVISPYLASMSLVYAWAPDAAYSNGTMAQWARSHRINTARYPAGMAAYWNWEAPSGMMGVSSLDPAAPPPVRQNYLFIIQKNSSFVRCLLVKTRRLSLSRQARDKLARRL